MALADEIEISYFRAGGPGGQHRNKKETGVRILHRPTGIVVTATERRERQQNLDVALERLRQKLAEHRRKPKPRRKTKPTRASVERRLAEKTRRSQAKRRRQAPDEE